ncbi:PilW family protein [Echinimonas agarilytica]|uniref:PilW family protein n=1 Tax=Echinimonas agarilytica TaxID=1215918 RepID=A0AA41W8G8_9GAMM|nr:PilW family protein [Echinimonas agarilytica]MCM2680608.1 PilW family protein [Echinimonas agarilytica]
MNTQKGMTLVELLVSLVIGTALLAGSLTVLTSNNASLRLNEALSSVQENGRFALSKLTQDVRLAGSYNPQAPELDVNGIEVTTEQAEVVDTAVGFVGAFLSNAFLGSKEGASGASDTLVIGMQGGADCTRDSHGYGTVVVAGQTVAREFHVVNEYYLDANQLKCKGYDGRVLRGVKSSSGSSNAVTLVENVDDFQILYGVAEPDALGAFTGQPSYYATADRATVAVNAGARVVAVQLSLLLFSEDTISKNGANRKMKLLDNKASVPAEARVYRTFEQTVMLRNAWNAAVFGASS